MGGASDFEIGKASALRMRKFPTNRGSRVEAEMAARGMVGAAAAPGGSLAKEKLKWSKTLRKARHAYRQTASKKGRLGSGYTGKSKRLNTDRGKLGHDGGRIAKRARAASARGRAAKKQTLGTTKGGGSSGVARGQLEVYVCEAVNELRHGGGVQPMELMESEVVVA